MVIEQAMLRLRATTQCVLNTSVQAATAVNNVDSHGLVYMVLTGPVCVDNLLDLPSSSE